MSVNAVRSRPRAATGVDSEGETNGQQRLDGVEDAERGND